MVLSSSIVIGKCVVITSQELQRQQKVTSGLISMTPSISARPSMAGVPASPLASPTKTPRRGHDAQPSAVEASQSISGVTAAATSATLPGNNAGNAVPPGLILAPAASGNATGPSQPASAGSGMHMLPGSSFGLQVQGPAAPGGPAVARIEASVSELAQAYAKAQSTQLQLQLMEKDYAAAKVRGIGCWLHAHLDGLL